MPPDTGRVGAGGRPGGIAARLTFLSETAPLIVSRAGLAMMGIVDMAMLARHASADLSAAALAEGSFGRILDICVAFLVGALPLLGIAQAKGDAASALAIWRRSCVAALALGAVCLLLSTTAGPLFLLTGQPPALAAAAGRVVAIHGAGATFALVAIASAVFLEGMKRAPVVALAVIVANLANLAFNPLFIAGGWGIPAMGAAGSALVTLVVRIGLCAMLVAMTAVEATRWREPLIRRPILFDTAAREQARIGATIAGTAASMHVFGIVLTIMAGWQGALALAAYASCWVLNLPFMLFAGGYGDAATLRVARGERDRLHRDAAMLALGLALPALAWAGGASTIASLYSKDPAMHAMLGSVLPMSGAVLWLDGMGLFLISAMRGRRDVTLPAVIQIATMALTVPCAAILAITLGHGIAGMVAAIVATSLLRLALLAVRAAPLFGPLARPNPVLPDTRPM